METIFGSIYIASYITYTLSSLNSLTIASVSKNRLVVFKLLMMYVFSLIGGLGVSLDWQRDYLMYPVSLCLAAIMGGIMSSYLPRPFRQY